jgi:hypothetical protein
MEFYRLVEAEIAASGLPDLRFSDIRRREGGWLSPYRMYLRVRYGPLFFDIGAIVAGNSLIVSWWLHRDAGGVMDMLAEIPVISLFLRRTIRAATYYKVDLIEHFQVIVHQAVSEVIRDLTEDSKLDYVPDEDGSLVREKIW